MAFLNDNVYDNGLAWGVTNGTHLQLCSADPSGTYATVTGNELGEATITSTLADGDTSGRKATAPASTITPSASGTCSHWAVTNNSDTVVASGSFTTPFATTNGVNVDVPAIDWAEIRDAISE